MQSTPGFLPQRPGVFYAAALLVCLAFCRLMACWLMTVSSFDYLLVLSKIHSIIRLTTFCNSLPVVPFSVIRGYKELDIPCWEEWKCK